MPDADWSSRAFHSLAQLGGVLYLAGGEGPELKNDVWMLDSIGGKSELM